MRGKIEKEWVNVTSYKIEGGGGESGTLKNKGMKISFYKI